MTVAGAASSDLVVLLAEDGSPRGSAPRATVHGVDTPLHLAFSCYVFDADGRVLLTRRALGKRTWPGVWTNAFCGHPRPGEPMEDAIARHGRDELGLAVGRTTCVLPHFRYRAVDASGTVENEVCPVYVAEVSGEIVPSTAEVMEYRWVETEALGRAVVAAPWALSPWLVAQVHEMVANDAVPGLRGPLRHGVSP